MKNTIKRWLAVGCAFAATVSLTSCLSLNLGDNGGKSAFQIYQETYGYEGTEEEWLASLKGADGKDGADMDINAVYEAAKENGYTGDFLSFLKEYFSVDVQENNDTATIARNLMSTVSVCCGFTGSSSVSQGSGVIINLDKENGNAYIVTNYHVVYESTYQQNSGISTAIYAYLYGSLLDFNTATQSSNYGMRCTYVGGAMDYDLAVLRVDGNQQLKEGDVQAATLGNSDSLTVGEKVFVIGNAEGDGISVTDGVLSVESEYITMDSLDGTKREVDYRVLRTSAAVNHGNSGGPIFNAAGQLIGIINAKNVDEDVENMGYALPINYAIATVNNILDNDGRLLRAMFGITVQTTASSAKIDENGRISITETCTIHEAAGYGHAAYGKLRVGDVLKKIKLGDKTYEITRRHQISDLLLDVRLGDTVTITVERGGSQIEVQISFDKDRYFTYYH